MKRRVFLATAAAAATVAAGSTGGNQPRAPPVEGRPGRDEGRAAGDLAAVTPADLPVPESELHDAVPRDTIAAITDPAFGADWSGIEMTVDPPQGEDYTARPRLAPDDRVIGVARGGQARAYPLAVLNWHEVVNDTFKRGSKARRTPSDGGTGGPLLVTYCPLCGSGMAARRLVGGEPATFGVSGLLWNSNLVMYDDRTDSLWGQVAATAIRGPATGTTLELVPSTTTTLGAWRDAHPETEVLLPPPESVTVRGERPGINVDESVPGSERYADEVPWDYGIDPYASYERSRRVGVGENDHEDDRLHPKAVVLGVAAGGAARAYPLEAVEAVGVVNDAVGGRPIVVTVAPGRTLVAYDARSGGRVRRFAPAGDAHLRAGGSRWERASGRAVDGPHEGAQLDPATHLSPMFWFTWLDFHPETDVYTPQG